LAIRGFFAASVCGEMEFGRRSVSFGLKYAKRGNRKEGGAEREREMGVEALNVNVERLARAR
jgi:hypothetical protein